MLGRGHALNVEEALRIIKENLHHVHPRSARVNIEDSYGRILAENVTSPEDLPAFSRSTMDGYAVISADTFGAGKAGTVCLEVKHEVAMGDEPEFVLQKGVASRIATGGMLPSGADAVLMLEHSQALDGYLIEVQRPVAPGENVIQRAEDVRKDALLVPKGRRLKPQDVSLLAGVGIESIPVFEKPHVSIISTGDEIVGPRESIRPGLIRDTNSFTLAGMLLADGGVPVKRGIFKDDYDLIRDVMELSVRETQAVLITGGSSVGVRDLTEKVMADMGNILFHSVSMKPGKPLLAGLVGTTPVFGLPGHPRAVFVCYEIFVRPVLRFLQGVAPGELEGLRRSVTARLARSLRSSSGKLEIVSVSLREEKGVLLAEPVLGKSGLLNTLVKAHGTIRVPANTLGFEEGEEVAVHLF
jgi:molybdopterin molybdotransferase